MNEPFADILCEKDDKRYIISVKARNMYQINGKLNSRYNLGSNSYKNAKDAEKNIMVKHIGWLFNLIVIITLFSLDH